MPKIYRLIRQSPEKCINDFVQPAVFVPRPRDDSRTSSVVAGAWKFFGNSSFGYKIVDRSCLSDTNYLNDGETRAVLNEKRFKRLAHINDQLYELELAKSGNESL